MLGLLEQEILLIVSKFGFGDYKGIHEAIKKNSFITIQRKINRLVDDGYLIFFKKKNNSKVFSLTEKGEKTVKNLKDGLIQSSEMEFQINKLHFYNYLNGKIRFEKTQDEDVDILGIDLDDNLHALIIQRKKGGDGIKDIFDRLLRLKEKNTINFIYIQLIEEEFKDIVNEIIKNYFSETNIKIDFFIPDN